MIDGTLYPWVTIEPQALGYRVDIVVDGPDGRWVAQPLVFETIDEGAAITNPTMTVTHDFCQRLMDQLWNAGIRPTDGVGSVATMNATTAHLDDMRAIVAHKLGVELRPHNKQESKR